MKKIKELFYQYQEIISYLLFGVLTTVVNLLVYTILITLFHLDYMISTVIAQIVAIIFAYITNKVYVFKSKNLTKKQLTQEIISFFGSRVFSLLLDVGFMYVFVDILHLNELIMKLVANIFIIVINYIFSKVLIFRKRS